MVSCCLAMGLQNNDKFKVLSLLYVFYIDKDEGHQQNNDIK